MTQINKKIIYPELSYKLTGIFFKIHSKSGRFCREKQYGDELEKLFKENNIVYKREFLLGDNSGNRVDFFIDNKILVDIKAKKFITKEDYYQMLKYLDTSSLELGLIVNFRNTYLKPKRVLNSKFKNSGNSDV